MGQNTNTGQLSAMTVYGNPESFKKIIRSHGQLAKVKQSLICPCVGTNAGGADFHCEICGGDGYIFTYQRKFLIVDENSPICGKVITPYWQPILSVEKVQTSTSGVQGGITDLSVASYDGSTITLVNAPDKNYLRRVTYTFDGWTHVEEEQLVCDVANKIMYADGTKYNSGYQSSNPLNAYADIARVVRIWNTETGKDLTDYTVEGNTIITTKSITDGKMYIEYYYADLTQVITTEIANKNVNEVFTHDLQSGECKMAFYPFWNLSRGDIIVISATVLYKNELVQHAKTSDKLWEIEIFDVNDFIVDAAGNSYTKDTDYILAGRYIKWIGAKPDVGVYYSVRYGYKPAYIIFEDNPQPNNLENKQYPVIVLAKSWSKLNKDDVSRLMN